MVQEMTHLISTNNYALLVCGLLVITISMSLIFMGCYCRRKSYRGTAATSLLNPLGKSSSNGFHRYRDVQDDDEEEDLSSIRRNLDDGSKNRISLNMNTSSCRYSKLEDNDKLLVDSEDEENEEKVFAR